MYVQWGKKVFSQPPIVQVLPLKKMREACNQIYWGLLVWGCCDSDTVEDLFRIQVTLYQHGYHSILKQYAIPSGLGLEGLSFVFQQEGQWPNTPPDCVRAILTRRRVMEYSIRWPGLHTHPTTTQLRWCEMSWTAEWRKSSQQVLSICGNSFKTVGKAVQVKLVDRMPRVGKAVIIVKGSYFEQSQI